MVITNAPNGGVIYDRKFTMVNLLQYGPQAVGRNKSFMRLRPRCHFRRSRAQRRMTFESVGIKNKGSDSQKF
jgi:hypothetical protein